MGTSMQAASTRKIAVKVPGRSTSVRKPLTMPPIPMPRLTRAKLMPKNWVRRGPETMLEVSALNPGQPTPKLMPSRVNASDERRHGGGEGQHDRAAELGDGAPDDDHAGPESVDQGPDRPRDDQGHDGDQAHEQPGDVERDAAHLVT